MSQCNQSPRPAEDAARDVGEQREAARDAGEQREAAAAAAPAVLGVAVAVPLPGGVVVHVRVRDGYGAGGCGHDTPKVRCQAISIKYMSKCSGFN